MKKKIIKATPKKLSVSAVPKKPNLYDVDFYKWTKIQASLLKNNRLIDLDINNLREEIESLGKSDKRALLSYIINLLHHLLKKEFQPERRSKSWDATIEHSIMQILLILRDSPSLKRAVPGLIEEAYQYAREKAARETKLDIKIFPKTCPEDYKKHLCYPVVKKKQR